jgi:EAL domain-containing protein (putative c-di-GMP-specific phosphodiesterase class I)/ActR/RegA family two-component response regulator
VFHDDDDAGPTLVMESIVLVDEIPPAPKSDGPAAPLGHLLVVEQGRGASVGAALERAGYAVQRADDGVAATQWLASVRFDALITDISTPGVDGLELLRFAKTVDVDLPVVLMTGAPDLETAAEAIELGAFQYLLKPVTAGRLFGAVEKAVHLRRNLRMRSDALQMLEDLPTEVTDADAPFRERFGVAMDQLWMAYQPIIRPDGTLFAYEALMRSDHEEIKTPGDLLDAAERLNAVVELGRRVREHAGQLVHRAVTKEFALFVNLHSLDLMDELLTSPAAPLSAIAPRVVLEITERAALHDLDEVKAKMKDLRAMGYRIALDDLGAGYAGLTSFAMLEPEIVKLDMALVRDIHKTPVKRKLVASVNQLSRDLGIQVVGEGVEVVEERDVLVELGCDLLQGYLFGKPTRF